MSLIHVPAFCSELFACAPYRKCAEHKIEMMKAAGVVCLALFFLPVVVAAQNKYPGEIVYGPKAAFNIAAPERWVLDNESGLEQGLPCVLYPKGESWADARTVMYAKIASTSTRMPGSSQRWLSTNGERARKAVGEDRQRNDR
jgi:hypothetical protein